MKFVVLSTILFFVVAGVIIRFMFMYNKSYLKDPLQVINIDTEYDKFQRYIIKFNKNYFYGRNKFERDAEIRMRFKNFKASLAEIERLNTLEGATVFGLTRYSDMSPEEFGELSSMSQDDAVPGCRPRDDVICKDYYHHHSPTTSTDEHRPHLISATASNGVPPASNGHPQLLLGRQGAALRCSTDTTDAKYRRKYPDYLPKKFDWRDYDGVVGPILDQKKCGGCWAFGIVGTMQSMAVIQNVSRQQLSVQELLDCSTRNKGCRGGNVAKALAFLCEEHVGIVPEEEYPLTLVDDRDCKVTIPDEGVRIKGFTTKCCMDEEEMLYAIRYHGPLVVIVNAANWYNYIGGVIRRACIRGDNTVDHVVMVVGYDLDAEIPHFILKNTYGSLFGDHGYVKVAIGHNVCGIKDEVNMIDVEYAKNNNSSVV